MAQPMTTFPEAYPQQNPHYGYDQGPPPAYNPAPSAPQTQLGSMAQPMTTFPEAYPQQNPHYGYDQGPPPAYNPAPSAPQTQVFVNQPAPATSNTVYVTTHVKPPSHMRLSILVLVLFNPVLGLIALVFSILSDSDYGAGNLEGARSKGKIALGLNIAGIVITTIVIIVAIICHFVEVAEVANLVYDET